MDAARDLTAALVGTGFVAALHVDALRRLGVRVKGVVGSTPERAGRAGLAPAYASLEAMLDDEEVDVVHVATPNHLHRPHALAALAAGKHVVCEKPLALVPEESAELVERARASGLVHSTCFNLRFYPLVHEARARVRAGALGDVWTVHGAYLQDWLHLPTDWNWRLDPAKGGRPRAVGDIGSHWLDAVEFVTGRRVTAVLADLATVIPVRRRPAGEVEAFAAADTDAERVDEPVETEDVAHLLLRLEGGVRAACVLSQVAAGRRNALRIEVHGSGGSLAWDSERAEELWLGHRDQASETLLRSPVLLAAEAARRTSLPAGHAEGYADTFRELFRAVYAAVETGTMPSEPDFPTFDDGHRANVLAAAVAASDRDERWTAVPAP